MSQTTKTQMDAVPMENIIKHQQRIARYEKSLALLKLKQRKADTRRKIELGGLVIKSGIDLYNKAVILGALDYALSLLAQNEYYAIFERRGDNLFSI